MGPFDCREKRHARVSILWFYMGEKIFLGAGPSPEVDRYREWSDAYWLMWYRERKNLGVRRGDGESTA